MISKIKITPKFNAKEIYDSTIAKDWFIFQNEIFKLAPALHHYMLSYITRNANKGHLTGDLTSHITFGTTTGQAMIGFHIGHIPTLWKTNPYWKILNYGGKVSVPEITPRVGKALKFIGKDGKTAFAARTRERRHTIEGIHYREASQFQLEHHIRNIINRLKRTK